ncbi:MAG: glycosyltransferase family 39 protein [Nitrospirae bacterium]|nr:glycosyltransferase family 39 protein [Nitrospirota bacterium]
MTDPTPSPPDFAKPQPGPRRPLPWRRAPIVLLLALTAFLLVFRLGTPGLTDRDEASFSEAVREMTVDGDWLTPHFNGATRFDKPPLIYYLMAVPVTVFGLSEFSLRLHSATAGVGLVLLVFLFARRHAGQRAAIYSAGCLAASLGFLVLGRAAITDMTLLLLTTGALFSFFRAYWSPAPSGRPWYRLADVLLALAFLVKGPVGPLAVSLAAAAFLFAAGGFRRYAREARPWLSVLIVLGISLPWFALMLVLHGQAYIDAAMYHTVTRYTSTLGGHGGTVFYYFPVVLLILFPWSLFLPGALREVLTRLPQPIPDPPLSKGGWSYFSRIRTSARLDAVTSFPVFLAIWVIVVFVFFSLSSTRLPHYVAPLFPPAAILVGTRFSRWMEERKETKTPPSLFFQAAAGTVLAVGVAGLDLVYGRYGGLVLREVPSAQAVDLGPWGLTLAAILFIGSAALTWAGFRRTWEAAWLSGVATVSLAFVTVVTAILPAVDAKFLAPGRNLARKAGTLVPPGRAWAIYEVYRPSFVFYSERRVVQIREGEEGHLAARIESGEVSAVLARESRVQRIKEIDPSLSVQDVQGGLALMVRGGGSPR